jgi:hypothetical protein
LTLNNTFHITQLKAGGSKLKPPERARIREMSLLRPVTHGAGIVLKTLKMEAMDDYQLV